MRNRTRRLPLVRGAPSNYFRSVRTVAKVTAPLVAARRPTPGDEQRFRHGARAGSAQLGSSQRGSNQYAGAQLGSGTALGLGIVCFAMAAVMAVSLMITASVTSVRIQNTADSAALAAADAYRGLRPGVPCKLAAAFVSSPGLRMASCTTHGENMRITVEGSIAGFQLRRTATAGPPSP